MTARTQEGERLPIKTKVDITMMIYLNPENLLVIRAALNSVLAGSFDHEEGDIVLRDGAEEYALHELMAAIENVDEEIDAQGIE